jgi:hypothetical protein
VELPLIAGVAGGVGTTTLARALYGIDCGIYTARDWVDVLVARSSMYSLGCAQRAIAAAPERPILAVVAEQPRSRLSGTAKARLRMTEPYVRTTVLVPYVGGWADVDDPHAAAAQVLQAPELSKPVRPFADALHELVNEVRARLIARSYIAASPHPSYPPPRGYPPPPPATAPHSLAAAWPDAQ